MLNYTGMLSVVQNYGESNETYVSLPDPSSMEIQIYDLDAGGSTGRNQNGLMLRDRKAVKEKIQTQFGPLREPQAEQLLALIKEPFFYLRYYSPYYGDWRIVEAYVGDRSFPVYNGYDVNDPLNIRYSSASMNFIER